MPRNTACKSTINFYQRVALILATRLKMLEPYYCCKKKGLKCVVKLLTGYYAHYIQSQARCLFVFSNTERGKINRKKQAKRLLLLQAKANAARL